MSSWRGRTREYDLVKELVIALAFVSVLTVALASVFSSPDEPQVTLATWSNATPDDFVATAAKELDGTSDTAGYGAPSCTSDYSPTTAVGTSPRPISCAVGLADNYTFDVSATASLYVSKAGSTSTVVCPAGPYTYNGAFQTPCTASWTSTGTVGAASTGHASTSGGASTTRPSTGFAPSRAASRASGTSSHVVVAGEHTSPSGHTPVVHGLPACGCGA